MQIRNAYYTINNMLDVYQSVININTTDFQCYARFAEFNYSLTFKTLILLNDIVHAFGLLVTRIE